MKEGMKILISPVQCGDLEWSFTYENGSFAINYLYNGTIIYSDTNSGVSENISNILDSLLIEERTDWLKKIEADLMALYMTLWQRYPNHTDLIGHSFNALASCIFNIKNKIILHNYLLAYPPILEKPIEHDNSNEQEIEPIQALIDGGKIDKMKDVDGKYPIIGKPKELLAWALHSGLICNNKKDKIDILTPELLDKYVTSKCNLETWRHYVRELKDEK